MSQLNLNTINRRRYEHKVTKMLNPGNYSVLETKEEEFSEAFACLVFTSY